MLQYKTADLVASGVRLCMSAVDETIFTRDGIPSTLLDCATQVQNRDGWWHYRILWDRNLENEDISLTKFRPGDESLKAGRAVAMRKLLELGAHVSPETSTEDLRFSAAAAAVRTSEHTFGTGLMMRRCPHCLQVTPAAMTACHVWLQIWADEALQSL